MSPQHPDQHGRAGASPEDAPLGRDDEARVRALLADARADAAMPPEVAARLDAVLADLAAGPPVGGADDAHDPHSGAVTEPVGSGASDAVVVPLASRRRHARRLLLVAAAVVVAGVGAGQLMSSVPTVESDDSAASAEGGGVDFQLEDGPRNSADTFRAASGGLASRPPVEVASDTFAADVEALLRRDDALAFGAGGAASSAPADGTTLPGAEAEQEDSDRMQGRDGPAESTWFECAPADWGPGRLVPVLYDGEPAVLAFRPRTGDLRVVDLLQCGSGEVLRSLTLPAR